MQRWSPRGRPWPRGSPRGHIFKFLALASNPQVLRLEPSSPRKFPCLRFEDSTIFCTVENARNLAENLRKLFLFSASGDRLKIILLLLLMGNGASESATVS